MTSTRNPAPPHAEIVEITPLAEEGYVRAVSVIHDGKGNASLQVHWRVDELKDANDWHPSYGPLHRTVGYLSESERIELARELVRGLLQVRLEVRQTRVGGPRG